MALALRSAPFVGRCHDLLRAMQSCCFLTWSLAFSRRTGRNDLIPAEHYAICGEFSGVCSSHPYVGENMRKLLIEGRRPLVGTICASGAKNSAVAVLPAALLSPGPHVLRHMPRISDVEVMVEILKAMGAQVSWVEDTITVLSPDGIESTVPYAEAKRLRGSALLLGPVLARLGMAKVPLPGGCEIGSRPIDLHLKGLQELGAEVVVEHGHVVARAPKSLQGAEIYLDFPSVGATENIMIAATAAKGVTVIYNAAKEPEVVDLATFLTAMGIRVIGAGTDIIKIEGIPNGTDGLVPTDHTIIPDRIEAGTYILAGMITGGRVTVTNVIPKHLESLLAKLEETGAQLDVWGESIQASASGRPKAIAVKTLPYPGFPTDLHPQLTAYLLRCEGTSIITERVFDDRFGHVDELKRLGANIKADGQTAVVIGTERLSGAPLTATDLRMGAALILAGLTAEGETLVDGMQYVERGYEGIASKLRNLGARVEWVDE